MSIHKSFILLHLILNHCVSENIINYYIGCILFNAMQFTNKIKRQKICKVKTT